jgi:hypothetical protein
MQPDNDAILKKLDALETIVLDLKAIVINTNLRFEKLIKIESYCADHYINVQQEEDDEEEEEQRGGGWWQCFSWQ